MKTSKTRLLAAALLAAVAAPSYATNGYFLPGFGVKSQGAGGVGISSGQDATSAAANPANATTFPGMRADVGLVFFNAERWSATGSATGEPVSGEVTPYGFNTASESRIPWFLMPDMAFTMALGDRMNVGMAVVGAGGMNITYKDNIYGKGNTLRNGTRTDTVGVDMAQVLMPISVAYKLDDTQNVGASLNMAVQRFKAYGLGQMGYYGISSEPEYMTNNGYDWSWGAGVSLGYLGKFMDDRVSVGAVWKSRTYMSKFNKYKGLFAEQGDFDIPENYGVGIAVKPVKSLTVAVDVTKILYSEIASVGNDGPGAYNGSGLAEDIVITCLPTTPGWDDDLGDCAPGSTIANPGPPGTWSSSDHPLALGRDQGMGFGWTDQVVYKLGFIYEATDNLTLRFGYNYGKMPLRMDQVVFSALAPAVTEHHYSIGFTYKLDESMEVSGFWMHVPEVKVFQTAQAVVDNVAFKMRQEAIGVALGMSF